ncbi:hypothetical protein KZZ52_40545 [Dactylosporangium sp. AC04546]|uniref:hypothetical protein n=1 Tax=Dactylosporangium sp. AC04546 TaxID=2862460 RepID=UPI001EDCC921|nr:hypothetical protein [Dactylosporangium sp. AC04546]WVK80236.1 hypothetical protein KZZ52_40545 [Dactylosporangium sp. AC04546]
MRRTGVLIVAVVALVVAGALVGHLVGRARGGTTQVTLLVGSEKLGFFADPAVRAAFDKQGFTYRADPSGSRDMANRLAGYDLAFPGSLAAAQELAARRAPAGEPVTVFSSPLAVATFTPIVDVLQTAGLAARDGTGVWRLDLAKLVERHRAGLLWKAIPGNAAYPAERKVLVATTHPQDSNSAAMYAALLDSVTKGDVAEVAQLFADQGAVDTTSGEPFEKYLLQGSNFAPLVLIYEAQFVDYALHSGIKETTTLIYPTPTVMCAHTVVPFTEAGVKVAKLLQTDPDLQRLAAEHGFRALDPAVSRPVLDKVRPGDARLPELIVGAVPAPDQATLHTLLTKVEEKLA